MGKVFSRFLNFSVVRVVAPGAKYLLIHPREDQNPFNFTWEPLLTKEIHNVCSSHNKDVVFFDIGGAFGIFTKYASRINPNARIFSFEPYWLRRYVMRINTMFCGRVKIINRFISGKTRGKCVTLEDAAFEFGAIPTVIKMDIEGGEYDALLNSIEFLKNTRPLILLEFHEFIMKKAGLRPEDIIENLQSIGYVAENIEHHGVSTGNYLIKFTYRN